MDTIETLEKELLIFKKGFIDYGIKNVELQRRINELTEKLIKSNKDYCPERIGYEVGYKYIHEHCNGLDCDKCTRDQIDKGLDKG